jgi:type IV fimbrial biogenesis protein FimT
VYPSLRFPRFPLRRRAPRRGFSLIELMVVVAIIAVLAVLAIPSIRERMRDRRTQEAAQRVAMIYREGRMRAMGRGAAVLVRFDGSDSGRFEMREGVRGAAGGGGAECAALPAAGCQINAWQEGSDDSRVISSFEPAKSGVYEGVSIKLAGDADGADKKDVDICFTPMGRTYVRYGTGDAFTPLVGVPTARVERLLNSERVGLERRVLILPNGASRVTS